MLTNESFWATGAISHVVAALVYRGGRLWPMLHAPCCCIIESGNWAGGRRGPIRPGERVERSRGAVSLSTGNQEERQRQRCYRSHELLRSIDLVVSEIPETLTCSKRRATSGLSFWVITSLPHQRFTTFSYRIDDSENIRPSNVTATNTLNEVFALMM